MSLDRCFPFPHQNRQDFIAEPQNARKALDFVNLLNHRISTRFAHWLLWRTYMFFFVFYSSKDQPLTAILNEWAGSLKTRFETRPGICLYLPFPDPDGSLNKTADQPLASWLGRLIQLRLSSSGSPLLSLIVNMRYPVVQVCGGLASPPCSQKELVWSESPRFASAEPDVFQCFLRPLWETEYSSQADPVSALFKGRDRLLCWLWVWLKRGETESEWEEGACHFSRELYSPTQPGFIIPHQRHYI